MVWVFGLNIHWHVKGTSSFISAARHLARALWDCYYQPNVESGDTGRLASLHTDHWVSQGGRVERGNACDVLVPGFTPKQPRQNVSWDKTHQGDALQLGKEAEAVTKFYPFASLLAKVFLLQSCIFYLLVIGVSGEHCTKWKLISVQLQKNGRNSDITTK